MAETMAIERAKQVFGAGFVNVQPHAGAQANAIAYSALLEPGDTILGLDLSHGGHLTHGMAKNFSGRLYHVVAYHVRQEDSLVDMDEVARLAQEHRPKMILAGWSAYPRHLDFALFREIADDVGAYLLTDMAHFAGLVAAGLHPNPVPHSHVVTTTVHKTLGGARGGMILSNDEELAKKLNSATFPGQQGGPLEHVIAGKAVALRIAQTDAFKERQQRTIDGAQALAEELLQAGHGVSVLTKGTDVHLILVDLRESELDGQQAEDRLDAIGITVNRNAVPFDPRPPMVSSGLRVGASALATRGLQADDFHEVGQDHRHRPGARVRGRSRPSWPSARPRSPSATRCTPSSAPQLPRSEAPRTLRRVESDALWAFVDGRGRVRAADAAGRAAGGRVGAVDEPRERGLADRPTPLFGGLAMLAGILVAAALFMPSNDADARDPGRRRA